jgi:N6-adenosine-specific RNA methylase IME4
LADPISPIDTRKELAKLAGVSHATIDKVKVINAKASEAAKNKLRRGETTINKEYQVIVNAERMAAAIQKIQQFELAPNGIFEVLVVDPPWQYPGPPGDPTRRGVIIYPTMTIEEIIEFGQSHIVPAAAENSILWLWTTNAFMRQAYQVLDAWKFKNKTILTWSKDRMGTGTWLRGQTEHCIMAIRGHPLVRLTNQTTWLQAATREHSRKPEQFYRLVESLCPGRRIEFFAREQRQGWTCLGAEVRKFSQNKNGSGRLAEVVLPYHAVRSHRGAATPEGRAPIARWNPKGMRRSTGPQSRGSPRR